jgi:hypothetical protein
MCQSCEVLTINGILCHETGCPNSWKDKVIECKNCGTEFVPEEKGQKFCDNHCFCMYNNIECDCEFCSEMDAETIEEEY